MLFSHLFNISRHYIMPKYITQDTVAQARAVQLQKKLQLREQYDKPIAEIIANERQQERMGNALQIGEPKKTYTDFLTSEKLNVQPNNLLSLLGNIADVINAKKIYDLITGQRSEADVSYLEKHWVRIEKNVRKNMSKGVNFRDLAQYIIQQLYDVVDNDEVNRQIAQTQELRELYDANIDFEKGVRQSAEDTRDTAIVQAKADRAEKVTAQRAREVAELQKITANVQG